MVKDFWRSIPGWFDFGDIYDRAVEEATDGAQFLEIGCWLGRSTCYLGQRIKESGKDIRLFVVDTFEGVPEQDVQKSLEMQGASVLDQLLFNISEAGIADLVTVFPESSETAHTHFEDRSLDLVFIDGDHSYDAVRRDILLFAPKVQSGGVLAGHDYRDGEGVRRAVDELIGDCPVSVSSWATRMKRDCLT